MRRSATMRSRLSRRRFLAGAGAGFAGLLAACSGPAEDHMAEPYSSGAADPSPTPSVTAENPAAAANTAPGLAPAQTDPRSGEVGAPFPTPPVPTVDESSSGASETIRGSASVTVDFIPIVSRRLQMTEISHKNLLKVWNGEITNWNELGEPESRPIQRVSVEGSTGPLPLDRIDVNIEHLDDLEGFLHFQSGAIALLPREQVNFRFRRLRVDHTDYLIHPDASNPLRTTIDVNPRSPEHFHLLRTRGAGPDPVSMTWVGDIIFGRFVHRRLEDIGDFAASFWNIHPELTWADLTIGNLECALSDNYPQPEDPQTFSFKTWTEAVEGLKLAQIDVLSRANNHSFNFGSGGMDDTSAVLDEAGIKHFGMGHNLDEARRAVVVEKNGVTYAFLGYNGISDDYDGAGPDYAGTMPLETDYVVQDIERELAAGHVVIPYFHWGVEYVADPSEEQRYFAQLAIDHGASLVMGSHPHWVQAVETYRGKAIVYSLGNFIFDQSWSVETTQGMIAHIWMKGADVLSIDLVPIVIENEHRPRVMNPQEAVPVLNRVWEASERIIVNG